MWRDDRKWLLYAVGGLVVAVGAPIGLFAALGTFDDPDGKRFAAVLAFAGVILTAAVSVIGFLVSRQSERRLDREHTDERARLRLEAAMKAGALFQPGDEQTDPATV